MLANIVGKPYAKIFNEFEGNIDPGTAQGSGDVKYHLGAHGTYLAPDGTKLAVELTANPSHLEAVNPVLMPGRHRRCRSHRVTRGGCGLARSGIGVTMRLRR